jgi:hypothetical protein
MPLRQGEGLQTVPAGSALVDLDVLPDDGRTGRPIDAAVVDRAIGPADGDPEQGSRPWDRFRKPNNELRVLRFF